MGKNLSTIHTIEIRNFINKLSITDDKIKASDEFRVDIIGSRMIISGKNSPLPVKKDTFQNRSVSSVFLEEGKISKYLLGDPGSTVILNGTTLGFDELYYHNGREYVTRYKFRDIALNLQRINMRGTCNLKLGTTAFHKKFCMNIRGISSLTFDNSRLDFNRLYIDINDVTIL